MRPGWEGRAQVYAVVIPGVLALIGAGAIAAEELRARCGRWGW